MTTTDHTLTPSSPIACKPMHPSHAVVFIDGKVDEWPVLAAGLQGSPMVVLLDPDLNGVEQMSTALATCRDLSAIHIISHGSPGALRLGSTKLSWLTLSAYGEDIKGWRAALQPGAEILIYGCEVAAGIEGKAFLQRLHELTGANLAASTTKTGTAELGGDWVFNVQLGGVIDCGMVVGPETRQGYQHVLIEGTSDNDSLVGGAGNDLYYVDNSNDTVIEVVGEGIDSVISSVNWTLMNTQVEHLTLTGMVATTATGNELANTLIGNGAANLLSGQADNDTLKGMAGNDQLAGGLGNDLLTGGSGQDIFVFDTAPNATTNLDTITDFVVVDDTIRLENGVFTALTATGSLGVANFCLGAAALDANDFVLYNSVTGFLSYDADGSGSTAAVQIALLGKGLALTNADFVVV